MGSHPETAPDAPPPPGSAEPQRGGLEGAKARASRLTTTFVVLAVLLLLVVFAFNL